MAGSIQKRVRDGKTSYRVRIDLPSADGTRQQRSRTVATKREAEAILSDWRMEAATGGLTMKSGMTVEEIAGEWLELARPRLRPKTFVDYERSVRLVTEAIGAHKVQDITPVMVQKQHRAWADAGTGARTIELAHLRLRQIMDLAVQWRIVRDNPARVVKPAPVKPKQRKTWTEDEARRFLEATAGSRWHLLWSLILGTGLRRGEALGLRWSDCFLDGEDGDAFARVEQTVELVAGRVTIGEPKTVAAKRVIDLVPELAEDLLRARAMDRDRARFLGGFDLIFHTHDGRPLNGDNVGRAFHKDIARAGVPHISIHDLRRTFATIASARGVPIRELAAILGHARPSVTLDIYAQATRAGGREAVGRVGRALFG